MKPLHQQKFLPTVLIAAGAICVYGVLKLFGRNESQLEQIIALSPLFALGAFSIAVGLLWLVLGRVTTLIDSFKTGYSTPRK